ncbi:hypothetical protein G195_010747 [Phytophthora kernoviae 00238/432]|uniref:Uncharacterized protein n=1 Tax=Phytophthora kernoviae 00238/432 TaxID=1284355 RepID=A0A8J4S170_9STRA|nr:hypothetical protein G195_010747 [Phytophthora kernoviae 00238/432]
MAEAGLVVLSGLLFGLANVLFPHLHLLTKMLLVLLSIGVLLLNVRPPWTLSTGKLVCVARIMDEVPIEFQVHAQATLAMYEGMGGVLGSLFFRSTFAWLSFSDEVYQWWGGNVYGGCKTKGG